MRDTGDIVKAACDDFAERMAEMGCHVQIFASWNEVGNTVDCVVGRGNWYARKGHVMSWLERTNDQPVNTKAQSED